MVTLKIRTKDKETKEEIATLIHAGLRGYEEYVNSNILLNFTGQEDIELIIGKANINKDKSGGVMDTVINLDYREED